MLRFKLEVGPVLGKAVLCNSAIMSLGMVRSLIGQDVLIGNLYPPATLLAMLQLAAMPGILSSYNLDSSSRAVQGSFQVTSWTPLPIYLTDLQSG